MTFIDSSPHTPSGARRKALGGAGYDSRVKRITGVTVVPEQLRLPLKISDTAWANSHVKRGPAREVKNPFEPYIPPASVAPKPAMAMDEYPGMDMMSGAGMGMYGSMIEEGQVFLGYPLLSQMALRAEYRIISETLATEATRKWLEFVTTGEEDKSEKLAKIEAEFRRLDVRDAFRKISEHDGFFGRGHLYLDTGDTDNDPELQTPLGNGRNAISRGKVSPEKPLKRIKAVEPVWTYPQTANYTDPLRDDWYKPTMWGRMGKAIHSSRLLTFVAREVPDMLKPAYAFGGLSMSQMAKPYVDNWLKTRQGVQDLITSFSTFVLKTNMGGVLAGDGGESLFRRIDMFNRTRDNTGTFTLDKDMEDFSNVSAPLGGLDHLQAQALEHVSLPSKMPLVKLTGISPSGLNASSEGELRCWEDNVHAYQETFFRPKLHVILGFVQLSLFGEVDKTIDFKFLPINEPTEQELAQLQQTRAQTAQVLVDIGAISQQEERTRVANDPDSPYDGLDPDEMPDLGEEEEEGLEPAGGHEDHEHEPGGEGKGSSVAAKGGNGDTGRMNGGSPKAKDSDVAGEGHISHYGTARAAKLSASVALDFKEGEHPRDEDGKFKEGSSGGGLASRPADNESHAGVSGGLSQENKQALKHYTGAGFKAVNGHLVGGREADETTKATVSHLDDLMSRASLPEPATVYRGAASLATKHILEAAGGSLRKGQILSLRGFTSTSASEAVARNFAAQSQSSLLIEMRLPKGAKAVDISQYSDTGPGEKETLIARNSSFKVVSFNKPNKLVLEMVMPQEGRQGFGAQDRRIVFDETSDNRFHWGNGAGIEVSGPDDGEVVFTREAKAKRNKGAKDAALALDAEEFKEGEHPRDNDGKFKSGSGGSSGGGKSTSEMDDAEFAAYQTEQNEKSERDWAEKRTATIKATPAVVSGLVSKVKDLQSSTKKAKADLAKLSGLVETFEDADKGPANEAGEFFVDDATDAFNEAFGDEIVDIEYGDDFGEDESWEANDDTGVDAAGFSFRVVLNTGTDEEGNPDAKTALDMQKDVLPKMRAVMDKLGVPADCYAADIDQEYQSATFKFDFDGAGATAKNASKLKNPHLAKIAAQVDEISKIAASNTADFERLNKEAFGDDGFYKRAGELTDQLYNGLNSGLEEAFGNFSDCEWDDSNVDYDADTGATADFTFTLVLNTTDDDDEPDPKKRVDLKKTAIPKAREVFKKLGFPEGLIEPGETDESDTEQRITFHADLLKLPGMALDHSLAQDAYSKDQKRGKDGKWTKGGGGASASKAAPKKKAAKPTANSGGYASEGGSGNRNRGGGNQSPKGAQLETASASAKGVSATSTVPAKESMKYPNPSSPAERAANALELAGAKVEKIDHSRSFSDRYGPSEAAYVYAKANGKTVKVRLADHDNGLFAEHDSNRQGDHGAVESALKELGLAIPEELSRKAEEERETRIQREIARRAVEREAKKPEITIEQALQKAREDSVDEVLSEYKLNRLRGQARRDAKAELREEIRDRYKAKEQAVTKKYGPSTAKDAALALDRLLAEDAEFKEDDHPRGEGGKFKKGGGSSASKAAPKEKKDAKPKGEKPAAAKAKSAKADMGYQLVEKGSGKVVSMYQSVGHAHAMAAGQYPPLENYEIKRVDHKGHVAETVASEGDDVSWQDFLRSRQARSAPAPKQAKTTAPAKPKPAPKPKEVKPLGARQLNSFAKAVNGEMASSQRLGKEKVSIRELYEYWLGDAPNTKFETFKSNLAQAAKEGLIQLERHDTPEGKPEGSEMAFGRDVRHYVVKPEPKKAPALPKAEKPIPSKEEVRAKADQRARSSAGQRLKAALHAAEQKKATEAATKEKAAPAKPKPEKKAPAPGSLAARAGARKPRA